MTLNCVIKGEQKDGLGCGQSNYVIAPFSLSFLDLYLCFISDQKNPVLKKWL